MDKKKRLICVLLLSALVGIFCGGFTIKGFLGVAMGVTGILLGIFWVVFLVASISYWEDEGIL
jgi:hypothetical protein